MPLDVRKVLSDWLDKLDWPLLNPDNPDMSQYTIVLANQLITELEVSHTVTIYRALIQIVYRITSLDTGTQTRLSSMK